MIATRCFRPIGDPSGIRRDLAVTTAQWGHPWCGPDSVRGRRAYAIDEQTAVQVVDGVVEIVSEGDWRGFTL